MKLSMRSVLSIAVLLAAGSAHAEPAADCAARYQDGADIGACQKLEQAKTSWEKRAPQAGDVNTDIAIDLLQKAEAEAKDAELKFDVLALAARALYWRGVNVPGSEENNDAKLPAFSAGQGKADAAIKLKPDYADGYYLASINLGKWGLAKGKLTVVTKVKDMKRYLNNALRKTAKGGGKGEELDFHGPYRVYGKMNIELPGLAGGDLDEGLAQLKKAYEAPSGKTHGLNVVYYAQALVKKGGGGNVALAKQILTEVVAYKGREAELNAVRTPETVLELQDAQRLLDSINRR
jgi:hypothetical protein